MFARHSPIYLHKNCEICAHACTSFVGLGPKTFCATQKSATMSNPENKHEEFLEIKDGELAEGVVIADLEGEGEGTFHIYTCRLTCNFNLKCFRLLFEKRQVPPATTMDRLKRRRKARAPLGTGT